MCSRGGGAAYTCSCGLVAVTGMSPYPIDVIVIIDQYSAAA